MKICQMQFFIQESTYTKNVLKHFHIKKAHALSTPFVVWLIDIKNENFHPKGVFGRVDFWEDG